MDFGDKNNKNDTLWMFIIGISLTLNIVELYIWLGKI